MAKMPFRGKEWYRNEYLKSSHWLEFAKVVRNFWGNKCALCNGPAKDVHHCFGVEQLLTVGVNLMCGMRILGRKLAL